jgi:hypothetical protein
VDLHLPNSLTAIGSRAFSGCTNLCCLILPPALLSLDATAFNLRTINLRAGGPFGHFCRGCHRRGGYVFAR